MTDYQAVLRRFREVAGALANAYVTAGWHHSYDPTEANRFIRYLEGRVAGKREHTKTEFSLIQFLFDHGQSADYVFRGDLTSMIAKLAATSPCAVAIPAALRNDGMHPDIEPNVEGLRHDLAMRFSDAVRRAS